MVNKTAEYEGSITTYNNKKLRDYRFRGFFYEKAPHRAGSISFESVCLANNGVRFALYLPKASAASFIA